MPLLRRLALAVPLLAGLPLFFFVFSPPVAPPAEAPAEAPTALAPDQTPAEAVAEAAQAFLATLDASQREKATYALDDDERFNFNFVPMARNGLPLQAMTPAQRRAAHRLMQRTLSSKGYLKATSIIYLENVLYVLENNSPRRNPELYYVTVFGTPSAEGAWGWRLEGHHLSLNFTAADGALSVTPAFLGANPADVPSGPSAGLRVLGAEEDLARTLLTSLTAAQRARVHIHAEAPADIITGTERAAVLESFDGLPAAEMTETQQALLLRLVEEYVHTMRPDVAHEKLEAIRQDFERLHFAWAGSLAPGEAHYYRIHGPGVLFEYDNIQNDANHIHTVWRDLGDDFGDDLLRRHYESAPADHGH